MKYRNQHKGQQSWEFVPFCILFSIWIFEWIKSTPSTFLGICLLECDCGTCWDCISEKKAFQRWVFSTGEGGSPYAGELGSARLRRAGPAEGGAGHQIVTVIMSSIFIVQFFFLCCIPFYFFRRPVQWRATMESVFHITIFTCVFGIGGKFRVREYRVEAKRREAAREAWETSILSPSP